MKLSTKGKYGLYAMFYLATHEGEGPCPLKAVSNSGVPLDYLEQLLGTLRRAGLVNSVRGANGGYLLAKAPEDITVGDILDATEGPVSISDCIGDEGCCDRSGQCRTRRVWEYLSSSINHLLQSITLKDMMEQEDFPLPNHTISL